MAQFAQSASGQSRRIAIDTDNNVVTPERIFVHRSEKGFVCVGLGAGAELMERAEQMDGALAAKRFKPAPARFGEPYLDRLALLAKDYNPDEARVPAGSHGGGEWTSGGIVANTASAAASLFETDSASVIAGLATIASRLTGPTAFFGALFIPTNRSLVSSGTLPGNPDVSYRFDSDTGTLMLTESNGTVLFSGHHGAGGVFRDSAGNAIGRMVDGALVFDPDALPGYASNRKPAARSGAAAVAQTQTDTDRNEPKLCPDPSLDKEGGKSPAAIAYQSHVSGLAPGLAVTLTDPLTGRPVYFDGCRKSDGVMLEAKGFSYENFITRSWDWQTWFRKLPDIESQALRQSRAAGSRGVEWHIADPDAAVAFEKTIRRLGIKNIKVVYDPPPARKIAAVDYWGFAP